MQGPGEGLPFLPPQEPGEKCLGRGSVCADSMAVCQPPAFLRAPGPPEEGMLQGGARERPAGLTKGRL